MFNFPQRTLSLLAAGLLIATALTTATLIAPAAQVQAETGAAIDPSRGFADLVDKVMPAVVSVQVKFANVASGDSDIGQMAPDEFFKQFPQFRRGQPFQAPQPRGGQAQGSGFIISADGYAVTNNHVVQGAEEVSVTAKD
ncbi:MAG: hypothetical protein ACREDU_10540, partial [Methylocella sp.]